MSIGSELTIGDAKEEESLSAHLYIYATFEGDQSYEKKKYTDAVKYYAFAANSLEIQEDKQELGYCLMKLGNIYEMLKQDKYSIKFYKDSIKTLPENTRERTECENALRKLNKQQCNIKLHCSLQ